MKGLILAGGYATRVRPVSYYLNKHLWPVYDRPLVEYAVERLTWAGISDIGIISGGAHPHQVKAYLGDGARYGARFTYIWQGAPRGIADAVNCAEAFCGGEKFVVHLADNILDEDLCPVVDDFAESYDCMVLLKEVEDPRRYGVAELQNGRLIGLEEKPKEPKSNLALVGVYGFNPHFFELFKGLEPSWRGEYELTDMISAYLSEERPILVRVLEGAWFSCDTFDALLEASKYSFERNSRRKRRT